MTTKGWLFACFIIGVALTLRDRIMECLFAIGELEYLLCRSAWFYFRTLWEIA